MIQLTGSTPTGYQDPPHTEVVFFQLEITDPCSTDFLSNPSSIASFEYIVDYTGLVTIPIQTFTQ